jgi:hypothetical protein
MRSQIKADRRGEVWPATERALEFPGPDDQKILRYRVATE